MDESRKKRLDANTIMIQDAMYMIPSVEVQEIRKILDGMVERIIQSLGIPVDVYKGEK